LAHRTFTDFHQAKAHLADWLQSDEVEAVAGLSNAG
jgi:hypothetical protein